MDTASFAPLLLEADAPSGSPPPRDGGNDRIEIVVGAATVRLSSATPAKRIGAIAAALASAL